MQNSVTRYRERERDWSERLKRTTRNTVFLAVWMKKTKSEIGKRFGLLSLIA